ncbi:MAG: efflux RND transporter permease subunit [Armatimonadetes bacterium]|nr:efflux RND transporter permease subunit [Armatimonadota bacterium]MDW8122823.1 efflux RND transporter permease subunit [Armatimonadota bacterium]
MASVKRPVLVAMAVLSLVVLGIRAYQDLAIELYPRIEFPVATITTVYPGADPSGVETEVTKPIEEAVGTIPNIRHITSRSLQGVSVIVIEFELGTDMDTATADIQSRIQSIRLELPDDIQEPVVGKFEIASLPVISMGMTGNRPLWQVRKLAEDIVAQRLARIDGVAQVAVVGGEKREIQVNVKADRLAAQDLSLTDIVRSLATANLNLPAGSIRHGDTEFVIRSVGKFTSLQEIRDTVVRIGDRRMGGLSEPVRLSAVADVVDSVEEPTTFTRLNGKPSVGISVMKTADANTVYVADKVKEELEELKKVLPSDIEFSIATDQSKFVLDALHDVNLALWAGIILATIVVFVFLHDVRGTFIIALAIPISIFATFFVLRFFGYSLNMMVMTGLSLAIGVLVDDSIVVLENIFRHLSRGELPEEAAINGRTEIGLAAVTITLVDVVVFVPMIFMGGMVGQFFKPFAVTVATAVLFSLLVSFTFTPMLAARMFQRRTREGGVEPATFLGRLFAQFDRFWSFLDRSYRLALEWALNHRALVFVAGNLALVNILAMMGPLPLRVTVAVLTIVGGLIGALVSWLRRSDQAKGFLVVSVALAAVTILVQAVPTFAFMPRTDEATIQITLEGPAHNSLLATDQLVRKFEKKLASMKEVESYFATVGSTAVAGFLGADTGPQFATLLVRLVPREERDQADREIAQELVGWAKAHLPNCFVSIREQSTAMGGIAPVEIDLMGPDRASLVRLAQKIMDRLYQMPELRDIQSNWRPGRPELRVIVDREKASDLGFSVSEVASLVRTAYEGNTDLRYTENGDDYPIRIRLAPEDRVNPENLSNLFLSPGFGHRPTTLKEVATVTLDSAPTTLIRKERQNCITISANLAPWASLGNVREKIRAILETIDPEGNQIAYGRYFQAMSENFGHLNSSLGLSIILIYMLMAGLFNSLTLPFSIMLSLPQALVGAILFLMLSGKGINIMSMIGIIMLMGLVTKNAILVVDYTNTLRSRGYDRHRAVAEAGETRLRPVLMTTLTMIFAVLPVALELGQGAEMRAPMAIAVLGGLTLSTFLTLLVVPVAYTIFDDLGHIIMRRLRGFRHPGVSSL